MTAFSKHVLETTRSSSLQLASAVQQHLTRQQRRRFIRHGRRMGCPTRPRERKTIGEIYREIGDTMFRRSYRMSFVDFKFLYYRLKSRMRATMLDHSNRNNAPNGRTTAENICNGPFGHVMSPVFTWPLRIYSFFVVFYGLSSILRNGISIYATISVIRQLLRISNTPLRYALDISII